MGDRGPHHDQSVRGAELVRLTRIVLREEVDQEAFEVEQRNAAETLHLVGANTKHTRTGVTRRFPGRLREHPGRVSEAHFLARTRGRTPSATTALDRRAGPSV